MSVLGIAIGRRVPSVSCLAGSRGGRKILAFGALLGLLCLAPRLDGHPVSLTSVFVNAEEDRITAELNMLVEDLILYYYMDTDEDFRFPTADLKEQAREHKEFLLRHFHLRDREGNRFEGEIVDIDFSELGEDGVHIDELMAYSIRYHFEFPFEEPPEFLTVSQDFGGERPAVPAEMGVRIFHHGVLMETVGLSHRTAHTTRLDWDAGWEHAGEDLEAARERLRERHEETLGITSYSAVYSYVYVTETEVRHEILIPLLTLEEWAPLERESDEVMTVDEQQAARDEVFAFLAEHNRIEIDGEKVSPVLERMDFFGPEARDLAREAPEQDVSVFNARVGVILTFPTDGVPPNKIAFEWDYFDERLPVFRPKIYVFDEESRDAALHPRERTFVWEDSQEREPVALAALEKPEPLPRLQLPLLSVVGAAAAVLLAFGGACPGAHRRRFLCTVLAGVFAAAALFARPYAHISVPHPFEQAPQMSEEEAGVVFETLHRNIYKAFGHRDEERVYDALDQSVAGRLLEELYLQIRENLTVEEQGGAVARISDIEIVEGARGEVSVSSNGHQSFVYRCAWTVTGTLEHWGHVHTRKNKYEATFTIKGFPSGWKITGFEPLTEERVDRQIRVRE